MKSLLIFLLVWALPLVAPAAAGFEARSSRFDGRGRFTVEVDVPAGTRHAVLESYVSGPPAAWKNLVSGPLDGRAARVIFRLPAGFSRREIVRAKIGPEVSVPPAQLNDPSLFTVIYEGGIGEQAKLDFLGEAAAKMREWVALPRAESQAKLIAWAHTKALVTEAVVSMPADNVSIRFIDGDVCVLLNKPRGAEALAADQAPADAYREKSVRSQTPLESTPSPQMELGPKTPPPAESLGLPASNRAVTAHSLESFFPDSAPIIGDWLTASGYDVRKFSGTTVDDVKGWFTPGPLGVLFWHVHGCSFKRDDGSETVGLVTRQFASVDLSKGAYKTMRDSGELLLAIDRDQTVPYYVVSSSFVRKYMRFAANSLVVVDACFGNDGDLAQAFIDAGAGSYVSWDWVSGKQSGDSCRKIFDRMLGMNQETPVSTVKERSFSQPIVETWMWQQGYEFDPSPKYPGQTRPNAQLIWRQHPHTPAYILKPTIIRILNQMSGPTERFSALMIEGNFGEDPGLGQRNVTWGGQLQQVLRWESTERIYIRVPNPAPVGNVQVLVNRGYNSVSNEVPITQWTVPFTWNYNEAGSLSEKMQMSVKFRADLHGERIYPEAPVAYLPANFWCIADGSGTMSGSGTYSPAQGVTLSFSGGSTMKSYDYVSDQVPAGHKLTNNGTVLGTGTFAAFSLRATGDYVATYTYVMPDGSSVSQPVAAVSNFDGSAFFDPMPSFNPATFVFKQGNKTVPMGSGTATLSWPATTAAAIPTADTPR